MAKRGKLEVGRCGLCCTLLVRLDEKDIERISKLHDEDYFVETSERGEKILKRVNGYCIFLKIEKGIASCTIYEHRPKVCREYVCLKPGDTECRLQRHYSVVELGKQGGGRHVGDRKP